MTSVRQENRVRRMIINNGRQEIDRQREIEAAFLDRAPRAPLQLVPTTPSASRRQVRSWMRRNFNDYDDATSIAEAANCVFDLPSGAMDDPEHWIWDEAADAIGDQ